MMSDCLGGVFEGVRIPLKTRIENRGLALLQFALYAAVVSIIVAYIVQGQSYYTAEEPLGFSTMWANVHGKSYDDEVLKELGERICADPKKYDYVYNDNWRYEDYTCTQIDEISRSWKEGKGNLYIPLSFAESRQRVLYAPLNGSASASESCAALPELCAGGWQPKLSADEDAAGAVVACECTEQAHYLVAGAGSQGISFEHYYEMVRQKSVQVTSRQHSSESCKNGRWICEDIHELKTIMRFSQAGKPESRKELVFHGSKVISMTLEEIFSHVGLEFDGYNRDSLDNQLSCKSPRSDPSTCRSEVPEYPLMRITGAELRMKLHYYNKELAPEHPELKGHRGPSCFVDATLVPKWEGRSKTDCARMPSGSSPSVDCLNRYYYGLVIIVEITGRFGFFDVLNALKGLGALLQLFRFPLLILTFTAWALLGGLSDLYSNMLVSKTSVDDVFVRFVTRSIVIAQSFRTLVGGETTIRKAKLIQILASMGLHSSSETRLIARLFTQRLETRHDDFVKKDAPAYSSEASGTNGNGPRSAVRRVQDFVSEASGLRRDMTAASSWPSASVDEQIDISEFVQGLLPTSLLCCMEELFDNDRRRCLVEYIFAPRNQLKGRLRLFGPGAASALRKLADEAQHARTSDITTRLRPHPTGRSSASKLRLTRSAKVAPAPVATSAISVSPRRSGLEARGDTGVGKTS